MDGGKPIYQLRIMNVLTFIVELLGLDQTGVISFEDFNKRIQKEEQLSTTVHSYGVYQWPEVVYLLDTVKGSVWVRSKVCFQETDEGGNENHLWYIRSARWS